MRVSFDLDDTLFVSPDKFRTEKELPFPLNKIFRERLRYGTVSLFEYIHKNGIELWIYTTSYRSEKYIKNLFHCYGLKIDKIINGEIHEKEVQSGRNDAMPSKYPSKYRIDLHIDDDVSVFQNGRMYGFNVHLVSGDDEYWTDKIISEIEKIKKI